MIHNARLGPWSSLAAYADSEIGRPRIQCGKRLLQDISTAAGDLYLFSLFEAGWIPAPSLAWNIWLFRLLRANGWFSIRALYQPKSLMQVCSSRARVTAPSRDQVVFSLSVCPSHRESHAVVHVKGIHYSILILWLVDFISPKKKANYYVEQSVLSIVPRYAPRP